MILDELLPTWEHDEHHERRIPAPPHQVWAALTTLRVSDLRTSMALLRLRSGPTAWRHGLTAPPDLRALDAFAPRVAVEAAPTEVVLLDIARYTGPAASRPDLPRGDATAFTAFTDPGFSKVAMNFHLTPTRTGTLLTTTTRVHSTDPATRRTFRPYWLLIRAGSGLIRRDLLAATAKSAHRA